MPPRARETVVFEYSDDWLNRPERLAIDQRCSSLARAVCAIRQRRDISSPCRQCPGQLRPCLDAELGTAPRRAGGPSGSGLVRDRLSFARTDVSRIGALRLRWQGEANYALPIQDGVPGYIALQRRLDAARRLETGEERDEDLDLIFSLGVSLGGAHPKCSVYDA